MFLTEQPHCELRTAHAAGVRFIDRKMLTHKPHWTIGAKYENCARSLRRASKASSSTSTRHPVQVFQPQHQGLLGCYGVDSFGHLAASAPHVAPRTCVEGF